MMIDRYLFRQVLQPLAAILGVLLAVFTSYSAAVFLADAVDGTLPTRIIAELTGLKALIALEVLIPASLYVSVLVAFARLHNDGEFTAMAAMGIRRLATMRAVLTLSAFLAVLVGSISLFVRPWAYGKLHELSTAAATLLDVDAMQAGTFYVAGKGDRVVFFDRKNAGDDKAENIFVRLHDPDRTRIIFARKAWTLPDPTPSGQQNVYLEQANIYDFHDGVRHPDSTLYAEGVSVDPNAHIDASPAYSAVAASTSHLARSSAPEDVAEFQWRLFTPISTFLLGLLAIPLSRVRRREGKNSQFSFAILIYFGYYLLSTAARTWVQHGSIPRFPGIWWVSVLLTLVVLTLMSASVPARLFQRTRA